MIVSLVIGGRTVAQPSEETLRLVLDVVREIGTQGLDQNTYKAYKTVRQRSTLNLILLGIYAKGVLD
jgi:hypothetical protein